MPNPAFNQKLGAMTLRDMFDNGQAQTCATGFARAAAVNPVKTFGQARQVFGCNARPGVPNLKLPPAISKQRPAHAHHP